MISVQTALTDQVTDHALHPHATGVDSYGLVRERLARGMRGGGCGSERNNNTAVSPDVEVSVPPWRRVLGCVGLGRAQPERPRAAHQVSGGLCEWAQWVMGCWVG